MKNVIKTEDVSKEQIVEALKEYLEAKNVSQRVFATQSNVSDATINKMLNGKHTDISEAMWKRVWNAISSGNQIALIGTKDHSSIIRLCSTARQRCLMIGLTGDTGMGKTTSLQIISRQRNTYYVSYDKTMKAKQFFISILKEMGISFEGSVYDMVNLLADELNTKSNPLLIIDEAGKITHNVMLYMHVLRDKTKFNCGIVLAGMPYFKTNLIKNSNKQKEGFAEFFRRINLWHELQGLSRSEIEFICKQNGIEDRELLREFLTKKRFGDLSNALQLYQIQLAASLLN